MASAFPMKAVIAPVNTPALGIIGLGFVMTFPTAFVMAFAVTATAGTPGFVMTFGAALIIAVSYTHLTLPTILLV